jgi:hypothetical protein
MFGVGGAVPIFLIFYAALFPIFVEHAGRHSPRRSAPRQCRARARGITARRCVCA